MSKEVITLPLLNESVSETVGAQLQILTNIPFMTLPYMLSELRDKQYSFSDGRTDSGKNIF